MFPVAKVAVDVRGCFWHACPAHRSFPHSNAAWWAAKLARNVERDEETERELTAAGWAVVVVWEHEDPELAAERVEACVRSRRAGGSLRALHHRDTSGLGSLSIFGGRSGPRSDARSGQQL
jgi:G:T-mismatch repair DNA endonuclease (very short patch repair protein)